MENENDIGQDIDRNRAPEAIGVVITKRDERVNLCPVKFQTVSSKWERPWVVCVGLENTNYTLENIHATGEFVFAYPSKEQAKDILYCGSVSGRDVDKLKHTSLLFRPSQYIVAPQLQGAVANYECRVLQQVPLEVFTIVVGEILAIDHSGQSSLERVYELGDDDYGYIRSVAILQRGRA